MKNEYVGMRKERNIGTEKLKRKRERKREEGMRQGIEKKGEGECEE